MKYLLQNFWVLMLQVSLVINEFPEVADKDVRCKLEGVEPSQTVRARVQTWSSGGHEVLCDKFQPVMDIPEGQGGIPKNLCYLCCSLLLSRCPTIFIIKQTTLILVTHSYLLI